jgi:HPt (histidine-containing phosphotransfer) domain-containing protein
MQKSKALQGIEKIAKGNEQTKKELIEIFVRQISLQIEQLQTYLKKNNWEEIKKIAHSIKSSLFYIDLTDGIILAARIEKKAGINVEVTTRQVHELVNKCLRIINEFSVHIKSFS